MRTIVSFIKLPGRNTFKLIGRCLRHLLDLHGRGWNFSDLTNSAQEMKSRYEATLPREDCGENFCLHCQAPMARPSVVLGDAGQAYEVLRSDFVSSTLDSFYSMAGYDRAKERDATVTVFRGTKYVARSGGRALDLIGDRVVFWISKIRKCVEALLSMKIYRLGDRYLVQTRGVPLGGPISGIILELCLSTLERARDTLSCKDFAKECELKHCGRTVC